MIRTQKGRRITDFGQTYSSRISEVHSPKTIQEIIELVRWANKTKTKIALRGNAYSQGGHTFADGAMVIDTKNLKKIYRPDLNQNSVVVQSGVTWKELKTALRPYGLAPESTQTYDVFSIGGSVSVNAHGRNIDAGPIGETVLGLRLVSATGNLVTLARDENPELFSLVLGGFGLFGIIVDIRLRCTPNLIYKKLFTTFLPFESYLMFLRRQVLTNPDTHFHFGRMTYSKTDMWKNLFCVSYGVDADPRSIRQRPVLGKIKRLSEIAISKTTLGITKQSDWAKTLRMKLEIAARSSIDRAHRSDVCAESISGVSKVLPLKNDILQEYFIPIDHVQGFVEDVRPVLLSSKIRLLNTTVRYVKNFESTFLSYADRECLAFVLFFHNEQSHEFDHRMNSLAQVLIGLAIKHGGRPYLCYQLFSTPDQLNQAYPKWSEFVLLKSKYDPDHLFQNRFFEKYGII